MHFTAAVASAVGAAHLKRCIACIGTSLSLKYVTGISNVTLEITVTLPLVGYIDNWVISKRANSTYL